MTTNASSVDEPDFPVRLEKFYLTIPTNFPLKPTPVQADQLMAEISRQAGHRWTAAKLGGRWLFLCDGEHVHHGSRSFRSSLADALKVDIHTTGVQGWY